LDYVKAYGELIKKTAGAHPLAARRMIYAGLIEELIRMKIAPKKEMPQALRMLNYQSVRKVYQAIRHPENSCWTNIFAPVEIMQCFGLDCVSMECLSSFMSGFMIEDHLIDTAESEGIASTLCSYHKGFIGGVDSGIFPPAPLSVPPPAAPSPAAPIPAPLSFPQSVLSLPRARPPARRRSDRRSGLPRSIWSDASSYPVLLCFSRWRLRSMAQGTCGVSKLLQICF
jgi:hypothetical protein